MDKDPFLQWLLENGSDPCLYFVKYSPDILKKENISFRYF